MRYFCKMNFRSVFLIPVLLIFMSFGIPKNIEKKVMKQIESTYQGETFILQELSIDPALASDLPSDFNNDNFFEIFADDQLKGYAYIADAPSKTDQFTYLVLLDPELVVKKSKVLIYREDYGGEIGSKRWLSQFNGKSKNDSVASGTDIMAISGATISVKSMTNAMNNLLKSLKILDSKNLI